MQGTKIVLTPEQEAWLRGNFAETKNAELARSLGISETSLHRFAREMGLTKTREFFLKCQRGAADAAKKWWRVEGRFLPKKDLPEHLKQHQYKKGDKPWMKCGIEKWREAVERGAKKRNQTFREEKARAFFGLPQRTRLRVTQKPRQRLLDRHYLKSRGYILDEVNVIAYWTPETHRATRMEKMPRRFYKFAEYETQ